MFRLFSLFPALALLAACANAPEQPPVEPVAEAEITTPEPAAEPVERPFPEDSIYPLLVAEFALRRGAYNTAMEHYIAQSRVLNDAGVAEHATHLAQFLDNKPVTLEAVQLWLQQDPDSLEANNTAATLLAGEGRPLEAVPHIAVVARAGMQANFPTLLQGYTALSDEDKQQLNAALADLSNEFPDDPALLLTLAQASAISGDLDTAQGNLDKLFLVEPEQHQALMLEARMNLQREVKNPFAHVEQVLENNPDDKRLRLEYARLLSATDLDAARKQFEVLSAQSPGDADLLFSLALINREAGDDVIARAYLNQVLKTGDRLDEAQFYLGMLAEKSRDTDTALTHYRNVGDSRQFPAANQRIGELLFEEGEGDAMQVWFSNQRQAFPQRAEQLYGIEAEILRSKGATKAAMETLNRGLQDLPESEPLRYARSMLSQQQQDLSGMESDLRQIIRQDPQNATALNALGYTLADQTDRLDEAQSLIARALELQPGEPAILDSMGWVLYRRGDLDGALEYLSRAYAVFPDPEVAAHLGEVLWARGEQEKAMQVWQGAYLADPQHKVLLDTLMRLQIDLDNFMSITPPPATP